jgi:hypothetical protein
MPLTMNRQPVTRLAVASLLLSTLAVTTARADETDTPTFTLSGFGTVGLAHSSEGQADFTNSPFVKKTGAGFSESWSANVDSVIGAQITANFTPQVSGVLQVISQLRFDGSYTPEVEWANLKYQFTPDFNVRVGRIGMPTLLVSDYRYVGYSTPWVRAPMDIYGLIPLTNNDGVDASYRIRIGNASSTFQASFGNSEIKNANGVSPTTIKRGVGLFNTTEIDRTTLHFAYQEADLSFPLLYPLADGFKQFGPAGVAIADKYLARDSRMKLMVIGAMYDADDWFVMAEVSKAESPSFIGNQTGWYVSGGYRMGEFTPYITFAESEKTSNITDPGLNAANFPAYLAGSIATLNAGLNNSLRGASGHTLSLGSRWDFTRNTALKVQYDRVMLSANSAGTLTNLQPGYKRGESYNVFSIALNFVF